MAKIFYVVDGNNQKFYPITIANAVAYIKQNGDQILLNEFLDSLNSSNEGKADKVSGAVAGNFAGLDANGNLTDSGVKAADFKIKQTAVADPTANGNATSFIDTFAQDANGNVTVTKKTVPAASGENAGLMSAADFTKLGALPTNAQLQDDLNAKADKVASATEGNFAGLNGAGNLVDSGKKASDFDAAGTAAGLIDALAGSASQTAADGNGNIAATVTSSKGEVASISVDASALKTAMATDATSKANAAQAAAEATAAADATQKANAAEAAAIAAAIGETGDLASADTIKGAKQYADDAVAAAVQGLAGALQYKAAVNANADLPTNLTAADKGAVYVVATDGTFDGQAMEIGDYLIWNGSGWDKLNGENQVANDNTDLVIGTAVQVATVDGTVINVKQVEDMTKLECEACGDTGNYPDVSSLFTTAGA